MSKEKFEINKEPEKDVAEEIRRVETLIEEIKERIKGEEKRADKIGKKRTEKLLTDLEKKLYDLEKKLGELKAEEQRENRTDEEKLKEGQEYSKNLLKEAEKKDNGKVSRAVEKVKARKAKEEAKAAEEAKAEAEAEARAAEEAKTRVETDTEAKKETVEKSKNPIDAEQEAGVKKLTTEEEGKLKQELAKLEEEERRKKELEEKRAQDAQDLTETNIGIMTAKKKAEEKEKEKGPVRETLEEKVEQKTKKPTGKKVKTSKAGSPDQPKADWGEKGKIPQTLTSALGQYQAGRLFALGYSEWQIKRMSPYEIKRILSRRQKTSEKKPVAPVPEKVGNEKDGEESKKETLKSDWTTEDEKTLNNLLVVVENENKTIENAKKRMTEIDAEIEKAKIQPEKIPEVKSEATLVEYSIDGKAITREEKEKEIDNRIVISGTSGGFTVFDATNIKNKGAGTSNDVRPMNYAVEGENYFKNSPEANKKWNGSDKPFTFIYTRNRRDYLIATAGLNAYTGKSDGGRNGNIFISIEITKDLPQWIEE